MAAGRRSAGPGRGVNGVLPDLALALAIGLLLGLERGWRQRDRGEGERLAGLRTFAITGLLGGAWGLIGRELGVLALGLGFLGLAAVVAGAHLRRPVSTREPSHGVTTLVSLLLTFALGALAVLGHALAATAVGVTAALLLGAKPRLHGWLHRLSEDEVLAVLKLALISAVILPLLPDRVLDPWGVLNPRELWLFVVLIALISFVGYVATRALGPGRGIPLTAVFGGLASSTATSLGLARLGRGAPGLHGLLATGVLLAAATVFPRVLVEVAVVYPALVLPLAAPMAAMTATALAAAALLWRRRSSGGDEVGEAGGPHNPLELWPALQFGVILAAVMLLAEGARRLFGDAGLFAVAGLAGLTDVDAITLSLARMARDGLDPATAVPAIALAVGVNTLVKALLVLAVGGRALGLPVLGAVLAVLAAGGLATLL